MFFLLLPPNTGKRAVENRFVKPVNIYLDNSEFCVNKMLNAGILHDERPNLCYRHKGKLTLKCGHLSSRELSMAATAFLPQLNYLKRTVSQWYICFITATKCFPVSH